MIFDILAILIIIEFVKILAEDGYSMVTGKPNPRLDRRRARQRSRANNRLWGTFLDYLGDVAEDARQQAAENREVQRERRRQERELAAEPEPRVIEPEPEPHQSRPSTEPVDIDLDDPQTPEPNAGDNDGAAPEQDPAPEPTPEQEHDTTEGPDAQIIPLFPTQEDPMTVTGEATGLVSAMNHAEALRKTYENYAAMGDTFVASLANGEVSGEAVNAAQRAREAEQLAAAEWAACHHALAEQLAVKEAYNATPDAGSKQFVTSE